MDKTMEKEYKWRADEKLLGQALLWASSRIGSQSRTINMESSYFDTADGLLKEHQAALRLRRENDRSVCCMKLRNTDTPDGMRAHEEYQCEAVSLLDGLRRLPELGAPNDLCERALAADLQEICTVSFRRCAVLLQEGDTVLAVHAASEQAHIVLASENSFFLRFPLSEIPFKKKTAVGVRGMKLSEGDLLSNVYWLEGDNSTEVEFHDRVVHINRLRIGARDGKGTKQK